MKSRRRGLRLLLLIVWQAALVLVLAELGVRLVGGFHQGVRRLSYNPRLTARHDDAYTLEGLLRTTGRGFKPFARVGDFRANSMGLRTPEYPVAKPEGRYRILAIGDSFTFASGYCPYREHWPVLFGSRLAEETGAEVEVINLGYPAVGPRFELRMWQIEGSRLDADLVVLAFYVGNDFIDGQEDRLAAPSAGDLLAEYSRLFRVTRNFIRFRAAAPTIAAALEPGGAEPEDPVRRGGVEVGGYRYRAHRPTIPRLRFERITERKMELCRKENLAGFDAVFERVARVLLEIREAVESSGTRLLMMIIPTEFQIDPEVARAGARRARAELADYDFELPQRRLRGLCADHGLDCLDLLEPFRAAGRSQKLYRLQNTHWSIEGNALAVEQLMEWARREIGPELADRVLADPGPAGPAKATIEP